jgi:hypothetical protein
MMARIRSADDVSTSGGARGQEIPQRGALKMRRRRDGRCCPDQVEARAGTGDLKSSAGIAGRSAKKPRRQRQLFFAAAPGAGRVGAPR